MASQFHRYYNLNTNAIERRPLETGATIGVQIVNTIFVGVGTGFVAYAKTQDPALSTLWGMGASGTYLVAVVLGDTFSDAVSQYAADYHARFNVHFNERVKALISASVNDAMQAQPITPSPRIIPLNHTRELPMADNFQESAIGLLRETLRAHLDDPTQIIPANKSKLPPTTWQAARDMLIPFVGIIKGRAGTFVMSPYNSVRAMLVEVENGTLAPSPTGARRAGIVSTEQNKTGQNDFEQ